MNGTDWRAEYVRISEENSNLKLQISELQKVVDAAVEWWADPHDTTKTIVDLQNAVEAYWEDHKTEKRNDECGSVHKGAYGVKVPACQKEPGHAPPHRSGPMEWD